MLHLWGAWTSCSRLLEKQYSTGAPCLTAQRVQQCYVSSFLSVSLWDGCVVARRCRERERESPSKDLLAVSDVEHTANALHLLVRTRGFRIGRIWLKDFRGFFVFHQHTVHTIQCTKKRIYIYIYIMRNSNSCSKLSRPSRYDRGALQFFRDRVCVCMCSSCSSWQFVFLDAAHAHRQTEQSSYIPFVFRACLSRNPPLK